MALPFPTLPFSVDPCRQTAWGRRVPFQHPDILAAPLCFPPPLDSSPETAASCGLWEMMACQLWGRGQAEARGHWESGFLCIELGLSLGSFSPLCPAQFGPYSKNNSELQATCSPRLVDWCLIPPENPSQDVLYLSPSPFLSSMGGLKIQERIKGKLVGISTQWPLSLHLPAPRLQREAPDTTDVHWHSR